MRSWRRVRPEYVVFGLGLLSLWAVTVRVACAQNVGAVAGAGSSVRGTAVDVSGAVVTGAEVVLEPQGGDGAQRKQTAVTDASGFFTVAGLAPGTYKVTVIAAGFAAAVAQQIVVHGGQDVDLPPVVLQASTTMTVKAVHTEKEIAEEQIEIQEKQRVLGVVPNFYASYTWDAAPLTAGQKFQLAWRSSIDPFTIGISAAIAGGEQAANGFPGYGQGAAGYFKRFGASYGDGVIATYIGGAILPSVLHQDPRYFYKGSGSTMSRVWYALSTSFICKSDSGKWETNYSNIFGTLAAGGISNLYYPASNRNGVGTTFESAGISLAMGSAQNLLQEFVIRHFTPHTQGVGRVP